MPISHGKWRTTIGPALDGNAFSFDCGSNWCRSVGSSCTKNNTSGAIPLPAPQTSQSSASTRISRWTKREASGVGMRWTPPRSPEAVEQWSLTTLREKLVKIGAKIVRSGRYVVFQMAEVAIPRELFADILRRIDRLRPKPGPA